MGEESPPTLGHREETNHGALFSKIYQHAPWRHAPVYFKQARLLWVSKLSLHITATILCSFILLAEIHQWGEYHRAAATTSCFFLMPKSCTRSDLGACSGPYQSSVPSLSSFECSLYTRKDALEAISHAIEQYDRLQQLSLAQFVPVSSFSSATPSSSCDYDYLSSSNLLPAILVSLRDGSASQYLLPINDTASVEALLTPQKIARALNVEVRLPVFDSLALDQYDGVYLWDFRLKLVFTAQTSFTVSTSQRIASVCTSRRLPSSPTGGTSGISAAIKSLATNSTAVSLSYGTYILRLFALVIALGYFALLVYDFQADVLLLRFARLNLQEARDGATPILSAPLSLYGNMSGSERKIKEYSLLPLRIVGRLVDGWRILQALAAVCVTIPIVMALSDQYGFLLSSPTSLLLGVGTALLWISGLGFLRFSIRFSAASLVLWASFFKVFRILLSAFPVALGFLISGIVIFGEIDYNLSSFTKAFITFFSVVNGDILWQSIDISDNLTGVNVLGCVFVVSMYVLFAYVILRLLLAIVESIYWYLRLYTRAKLKRKAFRQGISAKGDKNDSNEGSRRNLSVGRHTSEDMFVSLSSLVKAVDVDKY